MVCVCVCVFRLPTVLQADDRAVFFGVCDVTEALCGSAYSVERLPIPYVPQVTGKPIRTSLPFPQPIKTTPPILTAS